jgi:hypothetical protein
MFAEDTRAAKTDVMGSDEWLYYIVSWMNVSTVNEITQMWLLNEFILLYHLQIWHVYTAYVSQFSELVTSDVGAHRNDEQKIVTGRQFHETIFSTTSTALLI